MVIKALLKLYLVWKLALCSKAAYLTLSYTYLNSFKYPASFVFDTNQIAVGVHLPLDTKKRMKIVKLIKKDMKTITFICYCCYQR
jgi:hypothetical protein